MLIQQMQQVLFYHVPEHDSYHRSITTQEACICQEIRVHFSPPAEFTLLQRIVIKCQPPNCKQVLHLVKTLLNKQQSSCLKILVLLFM